jgi:hypothetical protein
MITLKLNDQVHPLDVSEEMPQPRAIHRIKAATHLRGGVS